jgi:hypothetical protein
MNVDFDRSDPRLLYPESNQIADIERGRRRATRRHRAPYRLVGEGASRSPNIGIENTVAYPFHCERIRLENSTVHHARISRIHDLDYSNEFSDGGRNQSPHHACKHQCVGSERTPLSSQPPDKTPIRNLERPPRGGLLFYGITARVLTRRSAPAAHFSNDFSVLT